MNIIEIAILIFIILETTNIIILYFFPDSKYGNGIAIFNNWHLSKNDKNSKLYAKYMKNWVAGSKLIFVGLLILILLFGNDELKLYTMPMLILSISTYYIKLHPIIKKLDNNNMITPKGYSKSLFIMITVFITMFATALLIYII